MFECKNTGALELDHINQTATYLGARLGMLGFVATRNAASDAVERKIYSVYNDTPALPRKTILVLSDAAMREMVEARMSGTSATPIAQGIYRTFRQRAQ